MIFVNGSILYLRSFNRINSCRSIPTIDSGFWSFSPQRKFQSYQFMQINPDQYDEDSASDEEDMFQSYQFMQINPDLKQILT